MTVAIGIGILVIVAIVVGFEILLRQGAIERAGAQAALDAIRALPMNEARDLAQRLLNRPGLFHCKPASCPLVALGLPPSAFELLSQFDVVKKGEFWIGREALDQTPARDGYVKLGEDFAFAEILGRPGDSRVFVAYGSQPPSEPLQEEPSIWHIILQMSEEKLDQAVKTES